MNLIVSLAMAVFTRNTSLKQWEWILFCIHHHLGRFEVDQGQESLYEYFLFALSAWGHPAFSWWHLQISSHSDSFALICCLSGRHPQWATILVFPRFNLLLIAQALQSHHHRNRALESDYSAPKKKGVPPPMSFEFDLLLHFWKFLSCLYGGHEFDY